jgi:uncharacterized membrane protein
MESWLISPIYGILGCVSLFGLVETFPHMAFRCKIGWKVLDGYFVGMKGFAISVVCVALVSLVILCSGHSVEETGTFVGVPKRKKLYGRY